MAPFRSRLAQVFKAPWPIAFVLTVGMAGVILIMITVSTLLDIRHERNLSREDLEARGRLLADTLNHALADPLYFLDVDKVKDVIAGMEMSQDTLAYIQVFRPDGSLLSDTRIRNEPGGNLAAGFVKSVLQNEEPVLEFHDGDLEITNPIWAGNQLVGIVHFDLATASLDARLMDIIWNHVWQGLAVLAVATLLAFAVARYVTSPLQALRKAAVSIGGGNLDYQIPVGGTEETASLGEALDSMRTELKSLYQDLEGQVAVRTQELSKANKNLEAGIVERQRLAQEYHAMAEIGLAISSSLEIDEVYERFAELVRNILPFDRISINTVDVQNGTRTTLVHVGGFEIPGRTPGTAFPLAGTFSEQVMQSPGGLIFQLDDLNQGASTIPGLIPFFQVGTRSLLGVPLLSRGKVIAVLNLASKVPQAYSAGDLVLAMAIGQQIAGALANAQQYADLARAEEATRVSGQKYRALVDYSPDMILVSRIDDFRFTEVNDRACEHYGYTRQQLLTMNIFDIEVEPPMKQEVRSLYDNTPVGRVVEVYGTNRRKDGTIFPVHVRFTKLDDEFAIANVRDITELKSAEEALRHSEERYRDLYESTPVMMHSVDIEGCLVSVNDHWLEVLGYERSEVIGRRSTEFLTEASRRYAIEVALPEFMKTGVANDVEYQMVKKNGEVMDVCLSAIWQRDQSSNIEYSRAIIVDMTERKRAEDKIKDSLQEKEVLLKEINHRVKNNLQIISSLLNLQSRDIQDEQALRSFQVSQDRIKAMALVHEKLYQSDDLARIDFGEYIKSLATDLGNSYGLGLRNIDLKIDVGNILLGVDTAIPCGVIVNELVANSLKHAFPEDRPGEIAISFREADGQYTMIFKDDGVGLPEDLDISRPSSLGLTIVNALTGQLGGTIELVRNGGSEICITFPAKQTKGD